MALKKRKNIKVLGKVSQKGVAAKKRKTVTKVIGKMSRKSGEVWRVASEGKVRNLTTRRASTRAMDEAMKLYGQALQRLANR